MLVRCKEGLSVNVLEVSNGSYCEVVSLPSQGYRSQGCGGEDMSGTRAAFHLGASRNRRPVPRCPSICV